MAEELIQYNFEGDSSGLQQATQQAINALDSYQQKVNDTRDTLNEFMSIMREIADNIRYLCQVTTAMATMMASTNTVFVNVKDSSTQYANALRSVTAAIGRTNSASEETVSSNQNVEKSNKKIADSFIELRGHLNTLKEAFGRTSSEGLQFSSALQGIESAAISAVTALKTFIGVDIAGTLKDSIKESMNYVENLNLFNVAMGESIDKGNAFVDKIQEVYGMDPSNIMTYVGNFNQLASAIEMPSEAASDLSLGMTRLTNDLASLFNMDVSTVAANMKSGLIGMTRAVTKYGMDIRTSTLQQTALSLGITENVKNMSEANREGLRYITMVRQASNVSGDWAKTIESPANQIRILKEQLTQLARAIGNLFLPALTKVLPYINGFIMAIRTAIQAIAEFFGFEGLDFGGSTSTIDKSTGAIESMGEAADETKKKIKQLQAPFDKLNVIQANTDSSKDTGVDTSEYMDPAIAKAISALNVPLENIKMKANRVRDALLEWMNLDGGSFKRALEKIKALIEGVKNIAVTLKDKLKTALEVDGNGAAILDTFKGILSDIYDWIMLIVKDTQEWASNLDLAPLVGAFRNLFEAVRNLASVIGDKLEGLYRNVMLPLAKWTIEKGLPAIINALAGALNWFAEHPNLGAVIVGIATAIALVIKFLVALPAIIATVQAAIEAIGIVIELVGVAGLGWIAVAVAAIAALIAIIIIVVTHLDEIKAWFAEMKAKLKPFFDAIKAGIANVYNFFKPLIDTVKNVILKVVEIFKTVWSNAVKVIKKVIEINKKLWEIFTALAGAFYKYVLAPIISKIKEFFNTYIKPALRLINTYLIQPLFKKISATVTNIVNTIIWAINNAIGFVEWLINCAVWAVNLLVKAANKVPGVDIDYVSQVSLGRISYLAQGGVITQPTQAIIGEGTHDEAVIPLGNSPQIDDMLDRFANKVSERPVEVRVQIGDSEWDAFTYRSAKRGESIVGKPILGGATRG